MTSPSIIVDLHGLALAFHSSNPALLDYFRQVYGHLPRPVSPSGPAVIINWCLSSASTAPAQPAPLLPISESELVSYYGSGNQLTIRMPKYALIKVDLASQRLTGTVTQNCLVVSGAFEDVLMISLAPLYRRRGWFPAHAFAALSPAGQVALITGQMGAGKTTTGLALLQAGWKLLSNDSPLLTLQDNRVLVLAYPGRLSAFDDSLARFAPLRRFIPAVPRAPYSDTERVKRVFRAEEAFPNPWANAGPAGGVFFPQVVPGLTQSFLEPLSPAAAVLALVPQAIEGWDRAMIGQNLQLLTRLAEQAPCYTLKLAPQVTELPGLIARGLAEVG